MRVRVYTFSMSILPHAVPAAKPKTKDTRTIAVFYAGILVLLAVTQLFTFDDFLKLFASFELPGSAQFTHFLAAFIVAAEVFAIPFLLRIALSPAFRWFSMFLGWVVAAIWMYITIFLYATHSLINTVGFLGTVVNVMPGWWAILLSVSFAIFAAWASWGMWPRRTH